jgi:hypothetical protein
VQTIWDEGAGHDNKWYVGTVDAVYVNGTCKIVYDDPDEWTGDAAYVYALPPTRAWLALEPSTSGLVAHCLLAAGWPAANPEADGSRLASADPGFTQKVAYASSDINGLPGMGGAPSMGAPVGPAVMGQPSPGYGAPGGPPVVAYGAPVMGVGMAPMGGGGMQTMTLTATVPGGHAMQFQGPAGVQSVVVPLGVQPGQQFQFQLPNSSPPVRVVGVPMV